MTPELLANVDGIEVWHGDCLLPDTVDTVLQGRKADLLHTDAPYSSRTHDGHREGKMTADRAAGFGDPDGTAIQRYASRRPDRSDIDYSSWSPDDVSVFNLNWLPCVTGWSTTITDHVLAPAWEREFSLLDRYVFQPLPWVEIGSRVRMQGDGPSGWTCWVIVARPRHKPFSNWGTLRGAYVYPAENHQNRPDRITGGKSLRGTCELISDYSRRGDLVLDPCLGGGTTAIAARMTGRRCIGIEKDRERAELCARLVGNVREQMVLLA